MPGGFNRRTGSEVIVGFIFSWGMLAATALVVGTTDSKGLKPEPGVKWGFSYVRCQSELYQGRAQGSKGQRKSLMELGFSHG